MSRVSVRRGRQTDADALTALYVQLLSHHGKLQPQNPRYHVDESRWGEEARRALEGDTHSVFVAERDKEIIGFVKLSTAAKPWGLSCEMDTLVVDRAHRRQGIGALLVRYAEQHAYEIGAAGIRVNVLLTNYEGREFYEREGYEPFSVRYGKPVREPD